MSNLTTWSGVAEELPEAGTQFLYNNERYTWSVCDCSEHCGRPLVHSVETEEESVGMTIRARGTNQGHPLIDVLLKTNVIKMDDLIDLIETKTDVMLALEPYLQKFDVLFAEQGYGLLMKNKVTPLQFLAFEMERQ